MKEIIEQVKGWTFLQQLPAEQAGFSLSLDLAEGGAQYNIFSYRNRREHREFSVVYDKTTKDFLARVTAGLNVFYDVSYICPDPANLEKLLTAKLTGTLTDLAGNGQYESIFRAKRILDWPYAAELPSAAAGFGLFISPRQPLKTVNGTYVIADYSDFAVASNLSIGYNVYRDEFFGQIRVRRTPQMIGAFDARELGELTEKLKTGLGPALEELRGSIGATEGECVE